jgi:ribosome assembly protein 4
VLSGHTGPVTKALWGGQDMIYTGSEDRSIRVWKKTGVMIRELKAHGHWVNSLAVSTEYCLRTGCWEMGKMADDSREEAEKRYLKLKGKVVILNRFLLSFLIFF